MKHIFVLLFLCLTGAVGAQTTNSLTTLIDSARRNNVALQNAQLSVEAAEEQRKEAFTNFFPNVSATGLWFNANTGMAEMSIDPQEMIPADLATTLAASLPAASLAALGTPITMSMMKNGTIASVMAMQPVFAGGQIVNGNKLAKIGEEAARLQVQLSRNDVDKTTEQYYWQLTALQEKQRTVAAADSLLSGIKHDVEVAVRAGVALNNDLLQVQLRLNDTESQRLKLENAIAIVRLLLAQHCGLKDTTWVLAAPDYSVAALPDYLAPEEALAATTEYQLLGKQVEAARLQQRIAVGKNLPSVAVGAGYNYHNLMETDHTFGMIFATVSVPISDWWGGSHAVKRKKIEYRKAVDEQQDKGQQLQIRMKSAWNGVTEARQQLLLAQRSIEQASENLRLQRNCYNAGTTKMSDLLEAQLLYQQSLDKRTDAYADYQTKLLEYKQAVGL